MREKQNTAIRGSSRRWPNQRALPCALHSSFLLRLYSFLVVFSVFFCSALFAQTDAPDLKGVYLIGNEEALLSAPPPPPQGVSLIDMALPGNEEELRKILVDKYIGQPLTQESLLAMQRDIVLFYRQERHPVVMVEVPEQEITDGVLQLLVIEGRVGKYVCKGNSWFTNRQLLDMLTLRSGQAITSDTLLTDIAWMNRNPFRHTDIVFTPGEKEGETDIELITKDRFPVRPYVGGDNTGNSATGQARWFAGFSWGNAFGCDQLLNYQYTTTTEPQKLQSHSLHYVIPLPWHHLLVAFGGYARIKPEVEHFYGVGRNSQVSLRYTIPVSPLYKPRLHEFSIGFDFKDTNNNFLYEDEDSLLAFGGRVNITQLAGSYSFGKEFGRHKVSMTIDGYYSPGQLIAHQSNKDFSDLRAYARNRYFYARATAGETYTLRHKEAVSFLLRGQAATANLLPSEQFGLGGYDTVRGYDEREINLDNALCLNGELRTRPFSLLQLFGLKKKQDELLFLAFIDYGIGRNTHLLPGERESYYLMSVGPGLRYKIADHVAFRADLGYKLHKIDIGSQVPYRWHIGGMISF